MVSPLDMLGYRPARVQNAVLRMPSDIEDAQPFSHSYDSLRPILTQLYLSRCQLPLG